jgi:hypothetical protein
MVVHPPIQTPDPTRHGRPGKGQVRNEPGRLPGITRTNPGFRPSPPPARPTASLHERTRERRSGRTRCFCRTNPGPRPDPRICTNKPGKSAPALLPNEPDEPGPSLRAGPHVVAVAPFCTKEPDDCRARPLAEGFLHERTRGRRPPAMVLPNEPGPATGPANLHERTRRLPGPAAGGSSFARTNPSPGESGRIRPGRPARSACRGSSLPAARSAPRAPAPGRRRCPRDTSPVPRGSILPWPGRTLPAGRRTRAG